MASGFAARSSKLKKKDKQRLAQPEWYREQKILGMATYVDLFADCRIHENGQKMLALCNFSEQRQSLPFSITDILATDKLLDLLSGKKVKKSAAIEFDAYQVFWLVAQ